MGNKAGSVYLRNGSAYWQITYYKNGKQQRESTKTTNKNEARQLLAERVAGTRVPEKRSIGNLLDNLLKHFEINEKSEWGPIVVRAHLRPHFGSMRADRLTKRHVLDYIHERKALQLKNGTINREITLLRRAFNLAEINFPKTAKLVENNIREGFINGEEFQRLMHELPSHIRPITLFGYMTGIRKGEILNLKWAQVDIKNRVVRLTTTDTKTGDARTIPLSEGLAESLEALPRTSDFVFSRNGRPIKSIRERWEAAAIRANLPHVRFHDLRRTAVRNLVRAGVPERIAMGISGHKTRSIFDRYNIVVEHELRDAMDKVESKFTQHEKTALSDAIVNGGLDRFLAPVDPPTDPKQSQSEAHSRRGSL